MQLYRAASEGKPARISGRICGMADCKLKLGAEARKVVTAMRYFLQDVQAEEVSEILGIMMRK